MSVPEGFIPVNRWVATDANGEVLSETGDYEDLEEFGLVGDPYVTIRRLHVKREELWLEVPNV